MVFNLKIIRCCTSKLLAVVELLLMIYKCSSRTFFIFPAVLISRLYFEHLKKWIAKTEILNSWHKTCSKILPYGNKILVNPNKRPMGLKGHLTTIAYTLTGRGDLYMHLISFWIREKLQYYNDDHLSAWNHRTWNLSKNPKIMILV